MNADEPTPLPDEADLARLNDALDARVDGRTARVPGTIAADPRWVDAVAAVRDALRRTDADAVLASHRETAVNAALAVYDAEFRADSSATSTAVHDPADAGSSDATTPAPTIVRQITATESDRPAVVRPVAAVADTATSDDATSSATVVHPTRWRRTGLVLSAAAALLVIGVAVTRPSRGADMESSGGATAAKAADDQSLEASAAATAAGDATGLSIDNAPPGETIGEISGAAVAAPVLETPDDLLALARTYEADLAVTDDSAAPAAVSVASERSTATAYDCPLTADQVALAEVQWQGALGVAVFDTVTGIVTVIDPTCAVLTSVAP